MTVDKNGLLNHYTRLKWESSTYKEVIRSVGIVRIAVPYYNDHFMFVFRENHKTFGVNSFIGNDLMKKFTLFDLEKRYRHEKDESWRLI